jgi:hypothetical protein
MMNDNISSTNFRNQSFCSTQNESKYVTNESLAATNSFWYSQNNSSKHRHNIDSKPLNNTFSDYRKIPKKDSFKTSKNYYNIDVNKDEN